jgi:hypothetical protein
VKIETGKIDLDDLWALMHSYARIEDIRRKVVAVEH